MKGITLLLAVLITASALAVSMAVFAVLYGELRLSGTAQDSLLAYYGADAGMECFAYWNWTGGGAFATSTGGASNTINCNGTNFQVGGTNACVDAGNNPVSCSNSVAGLSTLPPISFAPGTCTHLTVRTYYQNNTYVTRVDSFGESSSCGAATENTVQRSLFLSIVKAF